MRGINLDELDYITWGQLIDMIIAYNNLNLSEDEKKDTIRLATQDDWNKF